MLKVNTINVATINVALSQTLFSTSNPIPIVSSFSPLLSAAWNPICSISYSIYVNLDDY